MVIIKILDNDTGGVIKEFTAMAYNIDYSKSSLEYVSSFGEGVLAIRNFTRCERNKFAPVPIPIIEVVE